ncbi:MAG: radical SAM protein [Deltaproteobacteria bacterium]|nr:radical SAM protein [Deltaproteobacteria bacterium]
MRILLIYPYFLEKRIHAEEISVPPMGIYYVGAVLRENGYDVDVLNWHDIHKTPQCIAAALKENEPDVIGFSILHANRWGGIDIARQAKELNPRTKIVFGGIGATFLWRHLLSHFPEIDFAVLGEGELTFLQLVKAIDENAQERIPAIKGLAFRQGTRVVRTEAAEPIDDLDRLPVPARYFTYSHVAFTRGCPGNCTFCSSPLFWGHKVRAHSPDYFVDQLERLNQKGVNHFYFSDDTFTYRATTVVDICREIIRRGLDITWAAISRVNYINDEILSWMRRAGCTQISFGVESGEPGIRKRLNKKIRTEQVERAFALTQKYGIMARAYFIYGSPGENDASIQASIDLIDAIKPLSAIFYILDLFPGTRLYEDFKKRHGVTDDIWLERVEDILYFETDPDLTEQMILDFGRRLRSAFYGRLHRYVDRLALVRNPSFDQLHADFCSRLAMTFGHGDYTGIPAIKKPRRIAEKLYKKALGYHPDHRAFLGLGMLYQKEQRFEQAIEILVEGLGHFPESFDLSLCRAISHMNLGEFESALELLLDFKDRAPAREYIAGCYQAMGDDAGAAAYGALIYNEG